MTLQPRGAESALRATTQPLSWLPHGSWMVTTCPTPRRWTPHLEQLEEPRLPSPHSITGLTLLPLLFCPLPILKDNSKDVALTPAHKNARHTCSDLYDSSLLEFRLPLFTTRLEFPVYTLSFCMYVDIYLFLWPAPHPASLLSKVLKSQHSNNVELLAPTKIHRT